MMEAEMSQARFFITHSWHDIEFARKLCDDLHAKGLTGFLDERSIRPGESIPSRIERGLEECDIYIPIFSPEALKSPWCGWEIDIAITMNREQNRPHIIPVIAEKCKVPSRLKHLLYINFVERYDAALQELLIKGFGLEEPSVSPEPNNTPAKASQRRWLIPIGTSAVIAIMATCTGLVLGTILLMSANGQISPIVSQALTPSPMSTQRANPSITTTPTQTLKPSSTPFPVIIQSTATPNPTSRSIRSGEEQIIGGAPMLFIPAGDFLMGSNNGLEHEKPQHRVYLDAFWMDKYEVTNAYYKKCVDAGRCQSPLPSRSLTRSSYYGVTQFDNYPVVYITWDDANTFCTWAGKRLLSEAEWEKAARGVDARVYPWGGDIFDPKKLNSLEGGLKDTSEVGIFPSGASSHGVLDMAGNVWEWVFDWYDENFYDYAPKDKAWSMPAGPVSGKNKVVRGGSFLNGQAMFRTSVRNYTVKTEVRDYDLGFRCAQ